MDATFREGDIAIMGRVSSQDRIVIHRAPRSPRTFASIKVMRVVRRRL